MLCFCSASKMSTDGQSNGECERTLCSIATYIAVKTQEATMHYKGWITVNIYLFTSPLLSDLTTVTRAREWRARAWHIHGFQSLGQ